MMDPSQLTTPAAVFMAGVVTSVHCSAMCGPLTCVMLPGKKTASALAAYHAGRATAYMLIGGILGALGKSAAAIFTATPARILPWVLIVVFVILGLGLERRIPLPAGFSRLFLNLKLSANGATKIPALLGLATPFLPCAPLYLVFGVAIFSGSFFGGMALMAWFAAGTMPFYWLAQSQLFRLQAGFSPVLVQRIRRGMAWLSALLLAVRISADRGAGLDRIHCLFCR